jgi:Flp pilus assembly protein TadG
VVEGALTPEVPTAPRAVRESSRPHRRKLRLLRSERGTAAVEFAIIAPVLFLLVFGMIDFARALAYYNDLNQLAGQGARAAAVNRNPDGTIPTATSIQQQLQANADAGELHDHIVACIKHVPTTLPDYVQVKTSYRFSLGPTIGLLKIATINLSVTSTQLAETLPKDSTGAQTYAAGDQNGQPCS